MHADTFADGLTKWIRGDDGLEAEAAAIRLCETIELHRRWLKSHVKETF